MSKNKHALNIAVSVTLLAAGAALSSTAFAPAAFAMESESPFLPGVTTGTPIAALPPTGLYFKTDEYIGYGGLHDQNGNDVPVNVMNIATGNSLLWVPGLNVLGASYGAGVIQLMAVHDVDTTGIGGQTTTATGFFNTILIPATLSWSLPGGNYIGAGFSLYLPDGTYRHDGTTTSQTSYANNFWTFEPNFAYSWLHDGWDLTVNNVLDFNTENHITQYQSGATYYADLTAVRSFGPWTLGLIGNYTKQFTPDEQFDQLVPNSEIEHILVGPMVSYDFGKVALTARFLQSAMARNDINASFFHLSAAFAF